MVALQAAWVVGVQQWKAWQSGVWSVGVILCRLQSVIGQHTLSEELPRGKVVTAAAEDATSVTSAAVVGYCVASCVKEYVCSMSWPLWNRYWHVSIQAP